MKSSSLIQLSLLLFVVSSCSLWSIASSHNQQDFLQCLSNHSPKCDSITNVVYTPTNSNYSSVLNFSIKNQRFSTPETPKPLIIIKPTNISHIQAAVICSKSYDFQIRIRSGGHDLEGLSYVAYLPFIILDLTELRAVDVDVETSTAWVQSGATLGELYYKIAEKSPTLAFPAGICPTVGIGGYLSGGGYGVMLRKFGLAADNVIDATLVDADGKFHNRESMGEDLFWAIRGGGGGSFGIVVAWKLKLVSVPSIVTFCTSVRTQQKGAINMIHKWQYVADKLDDNLFIGVFLRGGNTSTTKEGRKIQVALFVTLFLGRENEATKILNTSFPELGLTKEECIETSWINSTLIIVNGFEPGEVLESLLNRSALLPPISITSRRSKIKSDYVKEPITKDAIKEIWERSKSNDILTSLVYFIPFGGRMSQISPSETPFPHRAGNLYKIGYIVGWKQQTEATEKRNLNWIRDLYNYMAPFVSKSPRSAYVNYRDLDIGSNDKNGTATYDQAMVWGLKYFGDNFNRLVLVKNKVDPHNFFRHEQSIPPCLQPKI